MYGYPRETLINHVRSKMFKKMVGEDKPLSLDSKVDLSRLPPCRDSLLPHVQRVNHRLTCYKKANVPIFQKPKPYEDDQGWIRGERTGIEPLWTKGSVLPQSIIDLLDTEGNDEDVNSDDEVEESPDYESDDDDVEE